MLISIVIHSYILSHIYIQTPSIYYDDYEEFRRTEERVAKKAVKEIVKMGTYTLTVALYIM